MIGLNTITQVGMIFVEISFINDYKLYSHLKYSSTFRESVAQSLSVFNYGRNERKKNTIQERANIVLKCLLLYIN